MTDARKPPRPPLGSAALGSVIRRLSERSDARLELEIAKVGARALVAALSSVESQLLAWLVMGAGAQEIAVRLGMTAKRAAAVRRQMMKKLNARSSADAVRIGIYAGLDMS